MSEFTKGPWELAIASAHAGEIATVHGLMGGVEKTWAEIWSPRWVSGPEQAAANALLIQHAPDMFVLLDTLHANAPPDSPERKTITALIRKINGVEP